MWAAIQTGATRLLNPPYQVETSWDPSRCCYSKRWLCFLYKKLSPVAGLGRKSNPILEAPHLWFCVRQSITPHINPNHSALKPSFSIFSLLLQASNCSFWSQYGVKIKSHALRSYSSYVIRHSEHQVCIHFVTVTLSLHGDVCCLSCIISPHQSGDSQE